MKKVEICVGQLYHDGKLGLREVLSIDTREETLRYRILAAKVEQEWDRQRGVATSVIGAESGCTVAAFASWAKTVHAAQARVQMLATMAAKRLRLPPGEATFMRSVLSEARSAVTAGTQVSYDANEQRAVNGLAKKGVLAFDDGEVTFLPLGLAWLELNRATDK